MINNKKAATATNLLHSSMLDFLTLIPDYAAWNRIWKRGFNLFQLFFNQKLASQMELVPEEKADLVDHNDRSSHQADLLAADVKSPRFWPFLQKTGRVQVPYPKKFKNMLILPS